MTFVCLYFIYLLFILVWSWLNMWKIHDIHGIFVIWQFHRFIDLNFENWTKIRDHFVGVLFLVYFFFLVLNLYFIDVTVEKRNQYLHPSTPYVSTIHLQNCIHLFICLFIVLLLSSLFFCTMILMLVCSWAAVFWLVNFCLFHFFLLFYTL